MRKDEQHDWNESDDDWLWDQSAPSRPRSGLTQGAETVGWVLALVAVGLSVLGLLCVLEIL
ncbi:MAG: hypothetical protein JKY94_17425 [Rhodobacteraceae bacterium]|nr:hypothetical protein [Paracoccaceae bacterium]